METKAHKLQNTQHHQMHGQMLVVRVVKFSQSRIGLFAKLQFLRNRNLQFRNDRNFRNLFYNSAGSLIDARSGHRAVLNGNRIHVIGGSMIK